MDSPSFESALPEEASRTPDLLTLRQPEKRRGWLVSVAIALVVVLLLGSATAYATHLGPFAQHAAAPATATQANLASLPCNAGPVVKQLTDTAPAPTAAAFAETQHTYASSPTMSIDIQKRYCVGVNTNRGLIVLELDPSIAPNTVNNFVFLAQHHFYDGIQFHRVVPNMIIQTGDPTGTGRGGPGYTFNDESVKGDYTTGCVAMANGGSNTNGSQFFICTGDDSSLFSKNYNLFGHVVLGLNIAQAIQGPESPYDPDYASRKNITPDRINHVTVVAVNAPPAATPTATSTKTATPLVNTCFLDPSGPSVPAVYAGSATPTAGPATAPKLKGTPVTLHDGLQYVDIQQGSGPAMGNGSQVTVNYTGWLASTCQKFDSSYDPHSGQPAQPFSWQIGSGGVITGWDEGLIGMKASGIRRISIPADLAYGAQGSGPIPPNADLIFDVQVVSVH
jgi:peptidylprolyl isomerase